ncbi:ABC transporter, substrate-binding protein (cluster 10, nitrate/sulfonate/bicarbonate) [hydrothermal vent metagenome]|uniref:ABC transporter, substrate-binding protein (Cluster 10, nitrate/sulfonate/bicarbonate) n=1 Tax=hydrothermal vent metagenome TaxID=652676 RepID=A0A3B0Y8E5_9ZZZZ
MKKTIRVVVIMFVVGGLIACANDSSDSSVSKKRLAHDLKSELTVSSDRKTKLKKPLQVLRVGWVYAMANAPIIIAKQKGYFAAQGLKVELKSYTSGPRVKKDLKAGRLDVAYIGAPPVYHWYSKGLKSKIIAKVNYGQAAVIVSKNSKITKMQHLRNKRMAGVRIGSGMDVLLRGYLIKEKAGMDPASDLDIIPTKPAKMGAAVESKEVSGAFSWEPFTSKYLLRGRTRLIVDVNKDIPRYPWYVVMAVPKAIKFKRRELVLLLKAHKKAVRFLNSSPTAGNDIIINAFKLKAVVDLNGKRHAASEILKSARTRLGWQARLTYRDTRFMQRLMNYSFELGYIKKRLKADDLIDIDFLYQAAIN